MYWDRRVFSLKMFDQATIGGFNAAEQDLTLWRGSLRDDCTVRDDGAFVNGYVSAGGTETGSGSGNNEGTEPSGDDDDDGAQG